MKELRLRQRRTVHGIRRHRFLLVVFRVCKYLSSEQDKRKSEQRYDMLGKHREEEQFVVERATAAEGAFPTF